jgi:hypothetical protein
MYNKINYFILLFLCFFISVNGQINTGTGGAVNVLPNSPITNTNVGIGTNTPVEKLDVNGNLQAKVGLFTNSLPNGTVFSNWNEALDKSLVFSAGALLGTGPGYLRTRMFHFYDFPQSNLSSKPQLFISIEDRNDQKRYKFSAQTGGETNMSIYNKSQQATLDFFEDGNDDVKLTLPKANSYIGIGTTSFTDGTDVYKLSVAGNIRANRVKVYTTWADFVFEKNYKLPTLEEVEKHITEKGHLKDIPSAKEVEVKGIELGEMNKLLLQKVEELTLYVIALNKELLEVKENLKKQ